MQSRSVRSEEERDSILRDDEKPRRTKEEELAELRTTEIKKHRGAEKQWGPAPPPVGPPPAVDPALSLSEAVARMEDDQEAALAARERAEMQEEREESARILALEAQLQAEIPRLRARELRKTFGASYAAAATD